MFKLFKKPRYLKIEINDEKIDFEICNMIIEAEKIINELSKAEVVRELIDQGMELADALRELARRMRLVQSGFKP